MIYNYDFEYWGLNGKVTFDGVLKLITVGDSTNNLSIKTDVYSAWKEWAMLRDNAKYLPAIRASGGDPIGGGEFTGDVYFLINGWRILIDHSCGIEGVIYSDNYPSPFIQVDGTQIVTNKVSSLVSVIAPTVNVNGITVPTVSEISDAVWSALDRSLTTQQITVEQVWNYLLNNPATNGSVLEKLKNSLSRHQFIALK